MKKISCVYKIYFKEEPDKMYIGSTSNLVKRICDHYNLLFNGKHNNKLLLRDYNKYGITSLRWEVLYLNEDNRSRNFLYEQESKYIIKNKSHITGYNLTSKTPDIRKEQSCDEKNKKIITLKVKEISEDNYDEMKKFIKNFNKNYSPVIKTTKNRFLNDENLKFNKTSLLKTEHETRKKLLLSINSEIHNTLKYKKTSLLMDCFCEVFSDLTNELSYKKSLSSYNKTNKRIHVVVEKVLVVDTFYPLIYDEAYLGNDKKMLYSVFQTLKALNSLNMIKGVELVFPKKIYDNFIKKFKEVIEND